MLVIKTREISPKKELKIKGDKFFIGDVDVSSLVEKRGDNFIAVMGDIDSKEFHDYFGLQGPQWLRMTGVTSVLDVVGDKSSLIQWAANMAVAEFGWVKQNKDESTAAYKERLQQSISEATTKFLSLDFKGVVEFITNARLAHARYLRKTAGLGKVVHSDIETLIKMAIQFNGGVITNSKVQNEQVQHFIDWSQKNNVIFKASEFKVFSRKLWVAGTCDIIMEIDNELYVGDIKTTNHIWGRSYFGQTAAYRLMLEEMYPDKYTFKGSILINIKRDGLFEPEEDVHYSPYFEEDKKFFLSALEIYRQEHNMFQT